MGQILACASIHGFQIHVLQCIPIVSCLLNEFARFLIYNIIECIIALLVDYLLKTSCDNIFFLLYVWGQFLAIFLLIPSNAIILNNRIRKYMISSYYLCFRFWSSNRKGYGVSHIFNKTKPNNKNNLRI